MTSVTLNGFCPLSKKTSRNFLHRVSSFEGTSYKNVYVRYTQSLDLLYLVLAFTSADMIFLKLLELHSTLSEKKIFVTRFLTDSLKPPAPTDPFNSQNLLSVANVFCQCFITYYGFSRLLCYDDARGTRTTEQNFNPTLIPGSFSLKGLL